MEITIRPLQNSAQNIRDIQKLLESAPDYHLRITGAPVAPDDGQNLFTDLPPNTGYEDKFTFGIYDGSELIGCADVARGYPNDNVAFIGLLLLSESKQRKGLGSLAYQKIENEIRAWPEIRKLRLSVIRTNDIVLPFWRRCGFVETGETKPYKLNSVESEHILMEKELR